ncbi:MAG: PQQ-dependent sugar dehydrogenase [Actinobacteria bacterium]|nr:PQQ-dependent sugar dehydrogenase [Actinomycetota bacterium]
MKNILISAKLAALFAAIIIICFLLLPACAKVQQKPIIEAGAEKLQQNGSGITEDKEITDGQKDLQKSQDKDNGIPSGDKDGSFTPEGKEQVFFDLDALSQLEEKFLLEDAFSGISFERPVDLQNANDGSKRLFVVEQQGRIYSINTDSPSQKELFLDITNRVSSGGEKGLLGLAFSPEFKDNGIFYVNYTNKNSTVISSFKTSPAGAVADAGSEDIILTIAQPFSNHNGGQIAFGPGDGYLYIATGDGGGAGDPGGNSQNLKNLLGKILRIDVDIQESGLKYAIPPDNAFKSNSQGYREEIYAYGLRNPWRFSFDPFSGLLWAADVGQAKIEEINIIENGKNYGWNIMEGSYCYNPPSGCDPEGLEFPVYEYEHPIGKSITGGYVYYGNIEVLRGLYIYADFVSGYIWGLTYQGDGNVNNFTLAKTGLNVSSFGIDEKNELYIAAFDGKIYRLSF